MKKIILTLIFIFILSANTFAASYSVYSPYGRLVAQHESYDMNRLCQIAYYDSLSHLENGLYKVVVEGTNQVWIIGGVGTQWQVGNGTNGQNYNFGDKNPIIHKGNKDNIIVNDTEVYISPSNNGSFSENIIISPSIQNR